MSDFVNVGSQIYNQGIAENSTTENAPLGTEINAKDVADTAYGEGKFVYLLGVASTVVGSVVLIDKDAFTTSLASANNVGSLAVAMAPTVANEFGWYQIIGKGVAKGLASLADNLSVYLTSTAGSLDDAIVAGDRVKGYTASLSAIDTPSTGLFEISLDRPFVDNGEAA